MDFGAIAAFLAEDASVRGFALPSLDAIVQLFESAFYASLTRDEGVSVRCDLLIVDPSDPDPIRPKSVAESRWRCIPFAARIPLNAQNIRKLAAAADPWATALAVYHGDEGWFVWGLIDQQTHYNRWRHMDAESGPHNPQTYRIAIEDIAYVAVYWDYEALLRSIHSDILLAPEPVFHIGPVGNRLKEIVEPFAEALMNRVGTVAYSKHPFWPGAVRRDVRNAIQRILLHIARYRHGGALLISSADDTDLKPKYSLEYDRLGTAVLNHLEASVMWREAWETIVKENPISTNTYNQYRHFEWLRMDTAREISGCVHSIASMARVDGLVWLSEALDVKGFGVEIRTADDPQAVVACGDAEVTEELIENRDPAVFGMRHRSMMRYCYAHEGALGFVVSQDGPVRAMLREGHRLLLWEDIRLHDE